MWTEQDATRATLAAKIEKHDAVLDLRDPARALVARIHAVSPKPGGAVTLETEGAEPVVLKISRASAQSADGAESSPGTLDMTDTESPLRIATGDGWLVPHVLQRPGGGLDRRLPPWLRPAREGTPGVVPPIGRRRRRLLSDRKKGSRGKRWPGRKRTRRRRPPARPPRG